MTQLCTIPTCHIPNRHKPTCGGCPVDCDCHNGPHYPCSVQGGCGSVGCGRAADECRGCLPRAVDDGVVCDACLGRNAARLEALIDLAPPAWMVVAGLVRRGAGGASGKPESRPPLNDGALDVLDEVTAAVVGAARWVGAGPGLGFVVDEGSPPARLIGAASWLLARLERLRHTVGQDGVPHAVHVFAVLAEAVSRLRGLVDGPASLRYLGPCGAPLVTIDPATAAGQGIDPVNAARGLAPCDGDVYGRPWADRAVCRSCRAVHDRADRQAWLTERARASDLVWTARGIADALNLNVKTIRGWANERRAPNGVILRHAKLGTFWRDGDHLVPWVDPPAHLTQAQQAAEIRARGDRLHYVADVVDLATRAAEEREQRAAGKTNSEGAAA